MLTPSRRMSAHERLAVYQRGYLLRLIRCLRSCFPGLVHLLGSKAFDVLAAQYVQACPPHSYTLDRFSRGFPEHLAATRPDADASADRHDTFATLVVDLARFERAFTEVYQDVRADPHRLLACRYPVHTYAAAVARGHDPPPPTAQPLLLMLYRRVHTVVISETSPAAVRRALAAIRARGAPCAST